MYNKRKGGLGFTPKTCRLNDVLRPSFLRVSWGQLLPARFLSLSPFGGKGGEGIGGGGASRRKKTLYLLD